MLKKWRYGLLALLALLAFAILANYHSDQSVATLLDKYGYADSKFVEIEGMKVHYRRQGEGMPVVLLHGTAASLHTWAHWMDTLNTDFEVISLDLPAFGLTGPHPTRDYSLSAYTQFLNAFLDKMAIDSCYLAGNSLGGRIAWEYVVAYPNRVKKLILLDATGYPSTQKMPFAFRVARTPLVNQIMLKVTPKSLYTKSIKEVYADDAKVNSALIDRYFELSLRAGNRQAFVDRANTDFDDHSAQIPQISIPTLIMWGDQDLWVAPKNAHLFHQDIPHSQLLVYKEVGHVPMEEIPERTAEDARRFFLTHSADLAPEIVEK
ncbi:MAG: alpha/beta hydrolase [Bacteroidota bacterium]